MSKLRAAIRVARQPAQLPNQAVRAIFARPRLRELAFRYADWRDAWHMRTVDRAAVPLPPATLRFRVHGDLDPASFLETGRQCSRDIKDALARVGKSLTSFEHVLDFGCGCGRTLLWLRDDARLTRFYGADIDVDAIGWCRRYIDFATFEINKPFPPLVYRNESFDLIYLVSVFTHLSENHQIQWLQELRRVTRPGGYVLVSVRGTFQFAKMSAQELADVRASGFRFTRMPASMRGIFPEWYQTATQTQEYIQSKYSNYFNVLEYVQNGIDHSQDVIILQRP
jgi:SAM-dependent methyltransferase